MYADRMRIVEELGCSIARGQRERGGRPTQNTPVGEETAVVRASVPAAFGRLDRPTDEIKRRGGMNERASRYHKADSGKGYTTGPDDETTYVEVE